MGLTKRDIALWQFAGFAITALGGTLLHFLYDWTGKSLFAAPFSAVNESTWEHMKLLYFPLFIFALIQRRFFGEQDNFWCVKLVGTVGGLLLIPLLFYTYNGAFGRSPDWLNIAIFFISAAAVFLLEYRALKNGRLHCANGWGAFAALCLIGLIFVVFTFATPKLPLFQDPMTATYGVKG